MFKRAYTPIGLVFACLALAGCSSNGHHIDPYQVAATSSPHHGTYQAQSAQNPAPAPVQFEPREGQPQYVMLDTAAFFLRAWQDGDAKLVASTTSSEYRLSLNLDRRELAALIEQRMQEYGKLASFELTSCRELNDFQVAVGYRASFEPAADARELSGELTLVREESVWRVIPPAEWLPR